jgi:hypothetical protein
MNFRLSIFFVSFLIILKSFAQYHEKDSIFIIKINSKIDTFYRSVSYCKYYSDFQSTIDSFPNPNYYNKTFADFNGNGINDTCIYKINLLGNKCFIITAINNDKGKRIWNDTLIIDYNIGCHFTSGPLCRDSLFLKTAPYSLFYYAKKQFPIRTHRFEYDTIFPHNDISTAIEVYKEKYGTKGLNHWLKYLKKFNGYTITKWYMIMPEFDCVELIWYKKKKRFTTVWAP